MTTTTIDGVTTLHNFLACGAPTIGDAHPGSLFFAETLDHDALRMEPRWRKLLKGIVKVHRLRAVTCLYGFTRFEPPTSAESEMDEIKLAVDGADLARDLEWSGACAVWRGYFPQFRA